MHRLVSVLRLLTIVGLWASFGGVALAQDSTPETADQPTVFVRTAPGLGQILTDPDGKTLYLFTKDTEANKSVCEGDCLANWPAFTADEPLSLPGGIDGELTSFDRGDGTMQVAYNGMPLYYFVADVNVGDTTGQGVGDVWYVVNPGQMMGMPMATPDMSMDMSTPEMMDSTTIDVSLSEFQIMASQTEFKVGVEYTFNITNDGQYNHEFVIEQAGAKDQPLEADGAEAEVEPMDAGGTATLTWTFTEAGNYQFACHVMTHYSMGMAVTIHVTE